jgi:uncharacterized membrane protein (UPF0127 family)
MQISKIKFNNELIDVYVCKTFIEKVKGATILDKPDTNIKGMLFVYNKPVRNGFWMYRMKFPLDIYFLDKDYSIIEKFEKVKPCNKLLGIGCKTYKPKSKYYYVLEIW